MNPSREKQQMHLTKISESGPEISNSEPVTVSERLVLFAPGWTVSGGSSSGVFFCLHPWLEGPFWEQRCSFSAEGCLSPSGVTA